METQGTEQGYLSRVAQKVTGLSKRQLDYWARSGFVQPSIDAGARGGLGGSALRRWSFRDLVALRTAGDLRRAGVSLQALRKVAGFLQSHLGEDFSSTYLVALADDVYVVHGEEELISALRKPGQMSNLGFFYNLEITETELRTALAEAA